MYSKYPPPKRTIIPPMIIAIRAPVDNPPLAIIFKGRESEPKSLFALSFASWSFKIPSYVMMVR